LVRVQFIIFIMLSNVSFAIKDVQGITKKQEEIRNIFTSNCQPTTAHFNIVHRVTAGLSILHKELLIKKKLAMELKKETSSVWKRRTKTTHTVWLQETKTLPAAWEQETKAKRAAWQQNCNLSDFSEYRNTEDNGHAGTSRYHPEAIDDTLGNYDFLYIFYRFKFYDLSLIHLVQLEITNQLILARRYRVIKIVGKGAFSKTVCAEDLYRNRNLVAIKIMISQYNHVGLEV
jgi:hypothetical protein